MKILAIGDVTSRGGVTHLEKNLWKFRKENGIDFTVVNGENASFISGISPELSETLLFSGADCITGGNHTMGNKQIYSALEENPALLRPINYGDSVVGKGYTILDVSGKRILVISAMGNIHIEPTLDSPYRYIDRVLKEEAGKYDFSVLDIHAEATGEKCAIAHAYDGKINVIFGTHTHVPTADERILKNGTGYITDLGMCGEADGILGVDTDFVIEKMRTRLPGRYKVAEGACVANGAIFEIDEKENRVVSVKRVNF